MKPSDHESGIEPQQEWNIRTRQFLRLYQEGQYSDALPIARLACRLAQQCWGRAHLNYAISLNNLAAAYRAIGDYTAAEPGFVQALSIRRNTLGEHHPDYANSLNNLAEFYRETGNYAAAEPLYRQASEIWHETVGENDYRHAVSLNNLGALYDDMGDYAAARQLYLQASDLFRMIKGESDRNYADSLNNLAILDRAMGDFTSAEAHYSKVIEINKMLGEKHPNFALSVNNLAVLYSMMGKYSAAEPLFIRASEVWRAVLGESHPDYAASLTNLAALYRATGNYAAAEPLYRKALQINRDAQRENHPESSTTLANLAGLCAATNRPTEALTLMMEAAAAQDRIIGQFFSIGSEKQRMAYLDTLQGNLASFLSLTLQHQASSPKFVAAALELVLRRKAIGAEALAVQREAVLGVRYPALKPQFSELRALRAQIARKTMSGPDQGSPEALQAHQQLLAGWNARKERLEAELARQIPDINLEQQLRAVKRQTLISSLPDGSALAEFIRFQVFDFEAVPARGERRWKPARYVAFLLKAGQPDSVQMIDLGEAEPIDNMTAAFWAEASHDARALTGRTEEIQEAGDPRLGHDLRARIFDPLLNSLGATRRLFLAPDGELCQVPFEVLPLDDGRRLIDLYQISYLSTGRDLLRFSHKASRAAEPDVVLADPDFDLDSETYAVLSDQQQRMSRQSRDLDRSLSFQRLTGTRQEGEQLGLQLGVKPLLAEAALEGTVKKLRSPRVLHLATHGYFLPDRPRDADRKGMDTDFNTDEPGGRFTGQRLENPLLRSGLVLAGANSWLHGKILPPEAEDGLLTAEDVTGMDLLDTELVVLSACKTGRGIVHFGEGVFGLRRAFVVAGAKTLVMSLWNVPDQATQELMVEFYHHLLHGSPRAEALRQAQLAMKARYSDPYYWGAFICQGNPEPL